MMDIYKEVSARFENFIFDWDYETYLLVGGYGSAKSYHIALKLILKCLHEKRKVLVVRDVYETIAESCFDLISEILNDMELLVDDTATRAERRNKVIQKKSPMEYKFPNGSRIIFKGMDKAAKMKSINDVSIIWLEECSEIKYAAYLELLGRVRTNKVSMHFILSCNPVGKENWVYRHFFIRLDDEGKETVVLDDEELYKKHTIVKNGVYYHHSVPDDNPYLPKAYMKRLNDIKLYDYPLWRVARLGRFGANGARVLPNFEVAVNPAAFKREIRAIPRNLHFYGFDFGFEESYNAVISMAVDAQNQILYIYDEIYINHVTDDQMAVLPEMQRLKDEQIVADNEDPKAIRYYANQGYKIRACRNKFAGSRLSNTRKMKRFKKIVCSPKCRNTIRELRELTYKKDAKGNLIYDEFNIDPHTFSAMWYGLDTYDVSDPKRMTAHSRG